MSIVKPDNREQELVKSNSKASLAKTIMELQDANTYLKDKARKDCDILNKDLTVAKRKLTDNVTEVENLQNRLNNEVQHLDNIRKAIESFAALRFPGTEFDPASYQPPIPTGYVKVEEPEELLALRHLYSLTGF